MERFILEKASQLDIPNPKTYDKRYTFIEKTADDYNDFLSAVEIPSYIYEL